MSINSQDIDMAQLRLGNRTHQNPQIKYAQRITSTPTQAFKPDTHLGITIRWGAPGDAQQGRDRRRAVGAC